MGPELMASHVWQGAVPFSVPSAGAPHCGQEIKHAAIEAPPEIFEPICGPPEPIVRCPDESCVRIFRVTRATANTSVPEEPSAGRGNGHLDGRIVRWLERRREVGGGGAPGPERNIEEAHGLTAHGQRLKG